MSLCKYRIMSYGNFLGCVVVRLQVFVGITFFLTLWCLAGAVISCTANHINIVLCCKFVLVVVLVPWAGMFLSGLPGGRCSVSDGGLSSVLW